MEQEAAYPIPISLYNCYRTVRHENRGVATYPFLISDSVSHASLSRNSCTKMYEMCVARVCATDCL